MTKSIIPNEQNIHEENSVKTIWKSTKKSIDTSKDKPNKYPDNRLQYIRENESIHYDQDNHSNKHISIIKPWYRVEQYHHIHEQGSDRILR